MDKDTMRILQWEQLINALGEWLDISMIMDYYI